MSHLSYILIKRKKKSVVIILSSKKRNKFEIMPWIFSQQKGILFENSHPQ